MGAAQGFAYAQHKFYYAQTESGNRYCDGVTRKLPVLLAQQESSAYSTLVLESLSKETNPKPLVSPQRASEET